MSSSLKWGRLLLVAALLTVLGTGAAWTQTRTFTFDADFDEGYLFNVNHDSPNNDQLQLNTVITPFPFINIACSNRGTAVRVDVNTGQILGEYLTAPNGRGRNPSRTTVDLYGNVWVANRDEAEGGRGSMTRIGLVIGGTRCDADGTPNPTGQYLKPPFAYSTVADRDGDGLIKTSYGLGNILPWTNIGGTDNNGGVTTAEDECIINYTRVTGAGTRTVAVNASNDVWVGGYNDQDHEKVSGLTGVPVPGTQFNLGCGGYGGLVDGNGVLWSADINRLRLLRYDPSTASGTCINLGRYSYGLGIDNDGNIWNSNWSHSAVTKLSPAGAILAVYPLPGGCHRGVAVTPIDNNVWIANSCANTVHRLSNAGTVLATIPVGAHPTGVSVDANGKVWVTNYNSHTAMRINPATNTVDLTVSLGANAYPYNYSDMTGIVVAGFTAPSGTWTVVHDGVELGLRWGNVAWNQEPQGDVPAGCNIVVEVRAADNLADLASLPFVPVSNGVNFSGIDGRYLEVRATLSRDAGVEETPVLSDLTVRPLYLDVWVDIKPTSCPNPLNLKAPKEVEPEPMDDVRVGSGQAADYILPSDEDKAPSVIPAAILGTADFDVTEIDPATVTLAGVAPIRWAYEDVAAPVGDDAEECECTTAGPDGFRDLTLKFATQEIIAAIGMVYNGDLVPLELRGEMHDGREIRGYDCMWIINGPIPPKELSDEIALGNWPNPFNPSTTINFTLPKATFTTLEVYNIRGQTVAVLLSEPLPAGSHSVVWNADGHASGLYFYRLTAADATETRKMLLVK